LFVNTKCDCGHQNHVGTVLCESCGKPLGEEAATSEPLEMRYDGVARRSQKANPSLIDRVWNFFSSVKIAVWLIVITLLASALGTIYKQETQFVNFDDPEYYKRTYGWTGELYYRLGLSHTYESWWFITLLVMIGTSLVVCSLDRVLPLYRALSKQQIRKHPQFLNRQKVVYSAVIEEDSEAWTKRFGQELARKRYRVHQDGAALLAEKNRFSRWGPYINHIGLIVFLLAVLAGTIPSLKLEEYIGVQVGDTVRIPNTNLYVKNEAFQIDYYEDAELPDKLKGTDRVKKYETTAALYECTDNCAGTVGEPELREVKRHSIIVNDPLVYDGYNIYQVGYDNTMRLSEVNPKLVDRTTGEAFGPLKLSIADPATEYEAGPFKLTLLTRFLDFTLQDGQPANKSRDANAPAFLFLVEGPGLSEGGDKFIYFPIARDRERFGQDLLNQSLSEHSDRLAFELDGMSSIEFEGAVSYLNVRVNRAMPFIWIGAAISMIGLIMGFYWQHRRIWIRIDQAVLTLGAHTNKNWYGMRADVASALGRMNIQVDPKSLDNGGNQK
jgi:cytochrome c biogenesis protein